jgi:hypothetical protein
MDAAVDVAVKEAQHRLKNKGMYMGHGKSLLEGLWKHAR